MTTKTSRLKVSGRKVSTTNDENKSMRKTNGDGTDKGSKAVGGVSTRNFCVGGRLVCCLSSVCRPMKTKFVLSPKIDDLHSTWYGRYLLPTVPSLVVSSFAFEVPDSTLSTASTQQNDVKFHAPGILLGSKNNLVVSLFESSCTTRTC